MAHPSIPEPERNQPDTDARREAARGAVAEIRSVQAPPSFEADLSELRAKFASDEGGHLSAELSADLALEIVLNEVVEQACLATGATGAAIILERDGEMVCRACTGGNAPELGARLDSDSGLTAACIRTGKTQRCDDALDDLRVDAEACKVLGVRSVLVLPLLQNEELVGVFELFSPHASAFGERDERTLEALSLRMLKLLKQSRQPAIAVDDSVSNEPSETVSLKVIEELLQSENDRQLAEAVEVPQAEDRALLELPGREEYMPSHEGRGIDVLTWMLGAAVLAFAAWLAVVGGEKVLRNPVSAHRAGGSPGPRAEKETQGPSSNPQPPTRPEDSPSPSSSLASAPSLPSGSAFRSGTAASPRAASSATAPKPPVSDGSLRIYENGKEIFRQPSNIKRPVLTDSGRSNPGQGEDGPVVEPAAIYELSPEAAEGSLVRRVEPNYPEEARQKGIQGPVILQVQISRDGAVQTVKVIRGQPQLAQASMAAVKQWVFKPRLVKGQRVPMQTQVTLNFRLPG